MKPARAPSDPSTAAAGDVAAARRLQMADIARLAGVSMSTVSRALNGSTLVNAETRARIEELARSLNYTINLSAKNLRLQENRTIAVVIPYERESGRHISDPFFLTMVGSLADELTERGFDMLLSRVDVDDLESATRPYDCGRAIGIILVGQWRQHDMLNRMAARKVPIVVWGAQMPRQLYCTVGGDNELGGKLATEHLLSQGRRRLLFLGNPDLPEVTQRYEGYVKALQAAGREPDPKLLLRVPFDATSARAAVEALCREQPDAFDGVLACSDLLALSAIQAVRACGRKVPADVSVIGYDNVNFAAYCDPPLTTIDQPIRQAGAELLDALLALIDGQDVAPRMLPVKLAVRGSSVRRPAR
jgi:DNA-binding LacI/PurR family transcriptional regulator